MIFENRREAGKKLAEQLEPYRDQNPIVLGLPRGGVEVAFEVASALNAPLDVIVAGKIGAPEQPEFGIGAVAPRNIRVLEEASIQALAIPPDTLEEITQSTRREVERRMERYRGTASLPDLRGHTAILVDDGLATGVTARAALAAARQENPDRIVLAVPVGAPETINAFHSLVDELVCLSRPDSFRAVGLWYSEFSQTSDDEVVEMLQKARQAGMP